MKRILLSPPHLGTTEQTYIDEALKSNWIAPGGPFTDEFERKVIEQIGGQYGVALCSGTAALHIAVRLLDIRPREEVFCSSFTFVASANPILYEGGSPVFIDSAAANWNMDPNCLEDAMKRRAKSNRLPRAVIVAHVYGQSADLGPIRDICQRYEVPVIEDAAESLGATYNDICAGTVGLFGVYSFNGNKIITTSGGGMLMTSSRPLAERARFLSTQARQPGIHFRHTEMGYNYRLSNVLAGIGLGQLSVLEDRIERRRNNFMSYRRHLAGLPGIEFMPEAPYGRGTRWLTCLTIDPLTAGTDRDSICHALDLAGIETRPLWQPLHLQPMFRGAETFGHSVSERISKTGLSLPSGSSLSEHDLRRVVEAFRGCFLGVAGRGSLSSNTISPAAGDAPNPLEVSLVPSEWTRTTAALPLNTGGETDAHRHLTPQRCRTFDDTR